MPHDCPLLLFLLQDQSAVALPARLMGPPEHRAPTLSGSTLPFPRSVPTTAPLFVSVCSTIQIGAGEPKANSAAFPTV